MLSRRAQKALQQGLKSAPIPPQEVEKGGCRPLNFLVLINYFIMLFIYLPELLAVYIGRSNNYWLQYNYQTYSEAGMNLTHPSPITTSVPVPGLSCLRYSWVNFH